MNERKLRGVGLIWDKVRLTRSEVRLTKYVLIVSYPTSYLIGKTRDLFNRKNKGGGEEGRKS